MLRFLHVNGLSKLNYIEINSKTFSKIKYLCRARLFYTSIAAGMALGSC